MTFPMNLPADLLHQLQQLGMRIDGVEQVEQHKDVYRMATVIRVTYAITDTELEGLRTPADPNVVDVAFTEVRERKALT